MIEATINIEDNDTEYRDLVDRLTSKASHVDIGIHAVSGEELVTIANAHEFGATIQSPGGTSFGFKTKRAQKAGKVRFLKKGQGVFEQGVTGPHEIKIPQRSFIRSTVDEKQASYQRDGERLWQQIIDGNTTMQDALGFMGQKMERDIKRKIRDIKTPPNKPATIRAKGSDNPLVDTGVLGGAIRYIVKNLQDQSI